MLPFAGAFLLPVCFAGLEMEAGEEGVFDARTGILTCHIG